MDTAAAHQANGKEPPPPYEESPSQPTPAPHKAAETLPSQPRPQPAGQPSAPQPSRQFPPTFNIYKQRFSRVHLLGVHQDQPLYAVRTHSGWSGEPDVVLHNGPGDNFPPLATANYDSWRRNSE